MNKRLKTTKKSKEFFDEILSDYIDLSPLLLKGFNKICKCILRDIIENCLKYIYYYDHPIEYTWLGWKEKYFLNIGDYLNYIEDHPDLKNHMVELELKSKLKLKYFELSKYIHSKNITYMQLRRCLKSIKFDSDFLEDFLQDFKVVSNFIITLIILFNFEKFKKINIDERRIILNSIDRSYKRYIQSI